ncbi:MAG: ribosome-binding factor A [Bacteroidota bacterium]
MSTTRQQKISRLIQKELGLILQFKMNHIVSGAMVTVTHVNVTPDLAVARAYLSLFATKDKKVLFDTITSHATEIRKRLAESIGKQVRVIPFLEFHFDDSLDYIENIEKLLKK